MGMLEQVFGDWKSFLTKPVRIREKTLDLATSSAVVENRLRYIKTSKGAIETCMSSNNCLDLL